MYYFGKMTLGTRSELTNLIDICRAGSELGTFTMHSCVLGNAKPNNKNDYKIPKHFQTKTVILTVHNFLFDIETFRTKYSK